MSPPLSPYEEQLFEKSLRTENPTLTLRAVVEELLGQSNVSREELMAKLEAFRKVLREQERDQDDDVVLEVMDFLIGWSSPHMRIATSAPRRGSSGGEQSRQQPTKNAAADLSPRMTVRRVSLGTSRGIWADSPRASLLRNLNFPPTAVSERTVIQLDLTGIFATPAVLQELILPLAQGIQGGVYGPLTLVVRTHDSAVMDFIDYLGRAHHLAVFAAQNWGKPEDIRPVGDLTSTEQTTMNIIVERGGSVTASSLAQDAGIEPTAAGNRLTTLARKRLLYRITRPGREGDLFVDPRSAVEMELVGAGD